MAEDLTIVQDPEVRAFLHKLIIWAETQLDLKSAALVGSYARGAATPASDVDLLLLVNQPDRFIMRQEWAAGFGRVEGIHIEDWGKVTSLRVYYKDGLEVEFGIAPQDWGADPSDKGDMRVIADGIVVLSDPQGVLRKRVEDYYSIKVMEPTVDINYFWREYLQSLAAGQYPPADTYEFWHFCDNEEGANELAKLTLQGVKTATSSLLWAYETEGEEIPRAGQLSIITNWDGEPVCLIETTEVRIRPFNDVEERVAYDEGEGDRSLVYWRQVHWEAFSRECASIGRKPEESMPVVNEWFRLIYPKQDQQG